MMRPWATKSSRKSRTALSSASSSRSRLHHRSPELVALSRHEREVERDAVQKALVAFPQGGSDLIRGRLDGERRKHLVGDEGWHLAPLLLARHRSQPISDLFPAVGFEDRAVRWCGSVERDLGPYRFPLLGGRFFVSGDDHESAGRERDLCGVAAGAFCPLGYGWLDGLPHVLGGVERMDVEPVADLPG